MKIQNKLVTLEQAKMLHDSSQQNNKSNNKVSLLVKTSEDISECDVSATVVNSICYIYGRVKTSNLRDNTDIVPLKVQFCRENDVYVPKVPFVLAFMPIRGKRTPDEACTVHYVLSYSSYTFGTYPQTYFNVEFSDDLLPDCKYYVYGSVPVEKKVRNS